MKQVPEVAELALDPATGRLRRDGVPLAINPFDRRALLEALRLKAEIGATVVALSMGPPAAEAALRECLGLGVDRAVHLCDARFAGSDTLATVRTLARARGLVASPSLASTSMVQVWPSVVALAGRLADVLAALTTPSRSQVYVYVRASPSGSTDAVSNTTLRSSMVVGDAGVSWIVGALGAPFTL